MNRALKTVAEMVLVGGGFPRMARLLNRRSGAVVLAYHNIVPTGASMTGDLSLHLAQESFAEQLDLLERTHRIVSLPDLLSICDHEPGPRAAITFDDAYRGALGAGLEELARRGLPATYFVVPSLLGRDFWWDALADADTGAVPEHDRELALEELCGSTDLVRQRAAEGGWRWRTVPEHARAASASELADAARRHPGVTFGSHTWSHPNLARLSAEEILEELHRSDEWLRERLPAYIPWLAYPYGIYSPECERLASRVYEAGLTMDGRLMRRRHVEQGRAIPRINIPAGISACGFELRTAGVPV